jgi:hypothetical protein
VRRSWMSEPTRAPLFALSRASPMAVIAACDSFSQVFYSVSDADEAADKELNQPGGEPWSEA